jgi:transposase
MDDDMKGSLDRIIRRKRKATSAALADDLATATGRRVSARTVRRARRDIGYHPVHQTAQIELKDHQVANRLAFCQAHVNDNVHYWLFSDEKKFVVTTAGQVMWIKHGEAPDHKMVSSTYTRVTVWAAVWWTGKSTLQFTRKSINSDKYQSILDNHLFPSAPATGRHRLVQDRATFHWTQEVQTHLDNQGQKVLDDWPAPAPDINAMEYVWSWMTNHIRGSSTMNYEELKAAIREAWAAIPQVTIHQFIDHVPHVMQSIIAAGGQWSQ